MAKDNFFSKVTNKINCLCGWRICFLTTFGIILDKEDYKYLTQNPMKTTKIKLALLAIVTIPFLMGCPKAKNTAPAADTELQSSVDVSFANFVVTDIDMICSFVGENDPSPDFYLPAPEEDGSKIQVIRDISADQLVVSYYNSARCIDGRVRNGSIFMYYSNPNLNAKYYREFEFYGRISLVDYKVDGWLIRNVGGTPCYVYNQLKSSAYDPSKTNITWLIDGSFEFIHPTDPSKNMIWTGKLTKTLANTSDPAVFNISKQQAIKWSKAIVEYRGQVTGVTSANVPYTFKITDVQPLVRDFGCRSDVVGGVTEAQPTFKTWNEEFHPFRTGIATFTTGDKYTRQIYYGNEGTQDLAPQCDNVGVVLIKGISYPVNFQK